MLTDQLQHPEMFLFVLPSLLSLVRNTGFEDYRNHVQPYIARVFQLSIPTQVRRQGEWWYTRMKGEEGMEGKGGGHINW